MANKSILDMVNGKPAPKKDNNFSKKGGPAGDVIKMLYGTKKVTSFPKSNPEPNSAADQVRGAAKMMVGNAPKAVSGLKRVARKLI